MKKVLKEFPNSFDGACDRLIALTEQVESNKGKKLATAVAGAHKRKSIETAEAEKATALSESEDVVAESEVPPSRPRRMRAAAPSIAAAPPAAVGSPNVGAATRGRGGKEGPAKAAVVEIFDSDEEEDADDVVARKRRKSTAAAVAISGGIGDPEVTDEDKDFSWEKLKDKPVGVVASTSSTSTSSAGGGRGGGAVGARTRLPTFTQQSIDEADFSQPLVGSFPVSF
jgi:hypothetical protein